MLHKTVNHYFNQAVLGMHQLSQYRCPKQGEIVQSISHNSSNLEAMEEIKEDMAEIRILLVAIVIIIVRINQPLQPLEVPLLQGLVIQALLTPDLEDFNNHNSNSNNNHNNHWATHH